MRPNWFILGVDLATGKDLTVVHIGHWNGYKMVIDHEHLDPSPSKLARLGRRVKQNNRRLARKERK
jgi:hypothetical protein